MRQEAVPEAKFSPADGARIAVGHITETTPSTYWTGTALGLSSALT